MLVSLYNSTVSLDFNERRHSYGLFVPGSEEPIPVPSVTQILRGLSKGEALTQWAATTVADVFKARLAPGTILTDELLEEVYNEARKAHRGESGNATALGSEVHALLEGYLSTILAGSRQLGDAPVFWPECERIQHCLETGIEWLCSNDIQPLAIERLIYSKKHSYCGMVDLVALSRGRLVLVDWKTSKAIYEEYELQVGAYVAAYEEETGEKFKEAVVVRLDKLGSAPAEERRLNRGQLKKAFKAFLGLLDVHKWRNTR